MSKVTVVEDTVRELIDESISAMATFDQVTGKCSKCGTPINYPLMVSSRDVKNMELLIKTSLEVMKEYGITGNLIADIKTRVIVAKMIEQACGSDS